MALSWKDGVATLLTAAIVFVFLATQQGWNVWVVGDSHRAAAVVVTLLGMATCALGAPSSDRKMSKPLAALGIVALALAVLSIVTGSLTALSLLVVTDVLLWAFATIRHATYRPRQPLPQWMPQAH